MNNQLEAIYTERNTFPRPKTLLHFTHNEDLAHSGMSPISGWNEIDEMTSRPIGIYFWNAAQEKDVFCSGIHKIIVEVSNLDTDKLFAYPVAISDATEQLAGATDEEITEYSGLLAEMKKVKAVPFSDYDGSFFAEWIYTGDIEAAIIKGE